ncbi:MAG TPA: TonB family protein [Candidatus Polarisedimenticolaceae bacterium]|nr:TonB family protein [Candidatus Polarisedimenticolaceae bacterium]
MFERTIEAQALDAGERRFRTVSVVALAHLTAVSFLAVVAALTVKPIVERPLPATIVLITPPPRSSGPERPLVAPQPPKRSGHSEPVRAVLPPPVPIETLQRLPAPQETPPPETTDGSTGPVAEGPDGSAGPPGEGGDHGGGGGGGGGGDADATGVVGPVVLTGEMIAPVRIVKVEPVYPSTPRIARMSGSVVVQAVVGLDGRIESAEILASTSALFNAAAIEAVRQWRYTPATMNGRPVRVYISVRVDFVLR